MSEVARRVDLPLQHRAATVATIDPEKRTVELVWSTGADVSRFDWWNNKRYVEALSMDPAHVRLDRLNRGAPLMADHRMYELSQVHGVTEKAWIKDGEGRAIVRFSADADAERIFAKVREGIVRNVSITYEVRRYEITKEEGKLERWLAVDWEPWEISLVPVGADPDAGTRSAQRERSVPCEIVNRAAAQTQESDMSKEKAATGGEGAGAETRDQPNNPNPGTQQVDEAQLRAQATQVERTRQTAIRKACRAVGLPEEFADGLVDNGTDVNLARQAIIDEVARRAAAHGGAAKPTVQGGHDSSDPANVRTAITDAIAARATRDKPKGARIEPTEQSRAYVGMSILEMLAEYARAAGHKVDQRQPRAALYDQLVAIRTLSTSDFPIILADSGRKIMVNAYQLATSTYRVVFAKKTFTDFKPHNFIRAGDFPTLLEKGEAAEFKYGSMSEAKNPVTLGTFGRIIGVTRRLLVNDDMGAFADLPAKAGRRVADFENTTAWAQLALNSSAGPTIFEKNMPTGRPLFHTADHGNLASSGTAIDVTNVGIGRAAMMKQTSLDGMKLNIMPRYLLVSPDKYTQAEQFCSVNIVPTQDSAGNPFKGRLTPVGDANLSGNAWHLFADPADIETLIYGYLEGAEGPQLAVREGFTTDGMEMRVYVDIAFGAVDYRGGYKNPGA